MTRFRQKQIALAGDGLIAALPAALLGFKDKRIPAVQIDPADRVAVVAMPGHDPLENIIVAFAGRAGRIGMRQTEHVAKLGEKQRVVGALLTTFLALPTRYERFCLLRARVSQADKPSPNSTVAPGLFVA